MKNCGGDERGVELTLFLAQFLGKGQWPCQDPKLHHGHELSRNKLQSLMLTKLRCLFLYSKSNKNKLIKQLYSHEIRGIINIIKCNTQSVLLNGTIIRFENNIQIWKDTFIHIHEILNCNILMLAI